MPIDSPQNQLVQLARSLHSPKGRAEAGQFLAEGPAVVAEALMFAPGIEWVAVCPERADEWEELADAARRAKIAVHEMSERAFAALSDTRSPQGIAAVLRILPWDLGAVEADPERYVALVLHDLRDPGNVGTMIRTADALGAGAVVLTGDCADPYEPKVVRATTGSLFHLPVVEADWSQFTGWAKDQRVSIVCADLEGNHTLGEVGLSPRTAFVIGNEAQGLGEQVLRDAALRVRIPMLGQAESLNAAVAAGIMLYEAGREGRTN